MHGKIAVTYFEWAGAHDQQIIVPWRLIDGPESADALCRRHRAARRYRRASRTSISGALLFAAPLFEGSGYRGLRRVIDVSGDGANNNGPLVDADARRGARQGHHHQRPADHAQAAERQHAGYRPARRLLRGLRDRRAGRLRHPDPGARRSSRRRPAPSWCWRSPAARRSRASCRRSADKPRISCTIGERLWQERWGGYD